MGELQKIAEAGADFGREQIEREVLGTVKQGDPLAINWDLANNDAAQWALNYAGQLIRDMTGARVRRVQQEIARNIELGESIGQLRQRLETMFDANRADMIAATEVTRAFAEGNMAAWRESGLVELRRWNTANDELVCPICGPLHNMVVALEDDYNAQRSDNQSAIVVSAPPAHPRCRCWLTPVVVNDN